MCRAVLLALALQDWERYGIDLSYEMAARAREDPMQRSDRLMQGTLDDYYISPLQAAAL